MGSDRRQLDGRFLVSPLVGTTDTALAPGLSVAYSRGVAVALSRLVCSRYAHYDNNPSFSDFSPFGGWSRPSIKQYTGTSSVCGASIDNDWCGLAGCFATHAVEAPPSPTVLCVQVPSLVSLMHYGPINGIVCSVGEGRVGQALGRPSGSLPCFKTTKSPHSFGGGSAAASVTRACRQASPPQPAPSPPLFAGYAHPRASKVNRHAYRTVRHRCAGRCRRGGGDEGR